MKKILRIGKPYLENTDTCTKLCSNIEIGSERRTVYFEIPEKYKDYICAERSDAFLIALMNWAQIKNCNIVCEEKITETLYHNIITYYIPIMSKCIPHFNAISVTAECAGNLPSISNAVGTGISCGADSWYTILNYRNSDCPSFNLTHLVLTNVGAFGQRDMAAARKKFHDFCNYALPISHALNLELLVIDTNLTDFYLDIGYTDPDCYKTLACVYAVQKLFSKYYYSSGFFIDFFRFDLKDPAYYDLFNMEILSTPSIRFYSSGTEVTRIDKMIAIAESDLAKKHLTVCMKSTTHNCGVCHKCIRTLAQAYAINKLEEFKDSFDVQIFEKNLARYLGKVFAEHRTDSYAKLTWRVMKENPVKIPPSTYVWGYLYWAPVNFIKKHFSYTKLKKIYYLLHIDVLVYGKKAERNE